MSPKVKQFLADTGAKTPVVCGPMYPGSNPELVAAVSEAGGLGVVQPVALTSLYGHDFREGLQLIKRLTDQPFGVNCTIFGGANKKYHEQMKEWMQISVEEGVKFFLTSLGKPDAVVKTAKEHDIVVYHDVPNKPDDNQRCYIAAVPFMIILFRVLFIYMFCITHMYTYLFVCM